MDTIVTVQLHDGSETLPTLLTTNRTVSHREVHRAQVRVVLPLATCITAQYLTLMACLAMCYQVAPGEVCVITQLAREESTLSGRNNIEYRLKQLIVI
jgi:hypothetical protein